MVGCSHVHSAGFMRQCTMKFRRENGGSTAPLLHRYCTGFAPLRIFAVWRVIFAACVFLGKEQLRQRFEGEGSANPAGPTIFKTATAILCAPRSWSPRPYRRNPCWRSLSRIRDSVYAPLRPGAVFSSGVRSRIEHGGTLGHWLGELLEKPNN